MTSAMPETTADTASEAAPGTRPETPLEAMPSLSPESLDAEPTRSTSETTTLDQIPKGEMAQVLEVLGDDPVARRLGDLGVRKGVEIEVLRRAPLGDPTVFELCSYQLCLRRSESARVKVHAHGKALPAPRPSGRP